MATAPSANDLTRQQLDELDDLLQRMLNLPMTGTEPPPAVPTAPAGPTWRYDAPAAPPAPIPHLVAPPEPPRAPAYSPPAPPVVRPEPITAPVPLIPPPEPTTPIIERKPTPPSRPAPKPAPVVTEAPPPAPKPQIVYEPQPPLPVPLWPLAALNWVFDRLAGLLGPPGWLLRSGFGKNVLGLAGIGLILYTAAHLATDAGLVTLPWPVPWPR